MRKRVLIVDDDQDIVQATCVRLDRAGYEAVFALDGDEAIRSVAEHPPDAIVLDVRMPVKDGLTTLAELKRGSDTQHIPVIMLSASIVDQHAALESGARFFLRKPNGHGQLEEALRTVLTRAADPSSSRRQRNRDKS
jgi:DNA-binding response OmpR family regulator